MNEKTDTPAGAPPRRPAAGQRGKALFLVGILAVMGVIYFATRPGRRLLSEQWSGDLAAALRRAAAEKRRVVAFFTADPMGEDAQRVVRNTLNKSPNPENLRKGRFLCVHVPVGLDPADPLRRKYGIEMLPTLLMLDANGTELNRREGVVGQMPFSEGFLDCSDVRRRKGS